MTAPKMLRVRPHKSVGDLPVPLADGTRLTHERAGAHGHLVADSAYIRRRIAAGELDVVAEGAAALPAAIEAKDAAATRASASVAASPTVAAAPSVAAVASMKGA